MTKKVLFIVGPALGHVGRSQVIAAALCARTSLQICFAGVTPGYGEQVIQDKFPFYKLPFGDRGDLMFAQALESLLAQLAPDLICLDLTPIPWLNLVRFPDIRQVYITNFFLTHLCDYPTVQMSLFDRTGDQINRARIDRGLGTIFNVKDLYDRNAVLLCDPPELVRAQNAVPTHYHTVGPCTWEPEPELELPETLNHIDNALFISFGSTGKRPLSVSHAECIATAVGARDIVWLSNPAHNKVQTSLTNHHAYSWLPSSQVLDRSRFVITHGGAGSTYQALAHGTPVGIWPSHKNQTILGSVIQDLGCGRLLEDAAETTDDLAQNFDSMKSSSRILAETLKNINGPKNAADKIMDMLP